MSLFEEFPPVTTDQWKEKIHQGLKGADYDQKLIWHTKEGFSVKPFYREEDLDNLDFMSSFPGDFPFIRGNKIKNNNWQVRQDIKVENFQESNKKALQILMEGVDSIGFIMNESNVYTYEELDILFKSIFSETIESNFVCGKASQNILEIIIELVKQYNRQLNKIHGSVDYDPLGDLTIKGNFDTGKESPFEKCKKLIETAGHLPHFKVIAVHGSHFHNAGATIVEEVAFSLSAGTEYLTQLTERGLSINKIAPRIKFQFAIGSNYFMQIAKLRATRLLWAHIVKAYGPSNTSVTQMHIHSITSEWNKTIYDPYGNMLRTTTESMSAALGGTDSLTVMPFNSTLGEPTALSERVARNQQLLLKEESYLDKVVDPAAGSYYIESLTNAIAEEAWKLFLEVEEKGGYLQAFLGGFIQKKICETARKRDLAIATREVTLLGTNQFPDFTEYIEQELNESLFKSHDFSEKHAIAKTLKPYRGAMAFEQLRYKTDQYAKANKRPSVFMFTYGNLAMRRARSQFASNFFGCAGFKIIDNPGFISAEEGVKAYIASKAEIVVLCAADNDYLKISNEIVEKLHDKAIMVIAGYPKAAIDELKSLGIQKFIHNRSNVLESLIGFQESVGIV